MNLKTIRDMIIRHPIGRENAFLDEFKTRVKNEKDLVEILTESACRDIKYFRHNKDIVNYIKFKFNLNEDLFWEDGDLK